MRSMNKSFFNSIRFKLILGLILVMLPILTFLIYYNFYSIHVVRNQVAQSNSNLLHLYMGLIDKELINMDNYLFQFASQESDLLYLDRPADHDMDRYHLVKYRLFKELIDNNIYYNSLDYSFIYSSANQDLVFAPKNTVVSNPENTFIKDKITSTLQDQNMLKDYRYDRWTSIKILEDYYLLHIIKTGNVYLGVLINTKQIMGPLDLLDLGKNGKSLLADSNNEPLEDTTLFKDNRINLNYERGTYTLTGIAKKYLVMGEESSIGNFSLLAVIPESNILEKLPYLQRVIFFIVCGNVLILVCTLFLLRKVVLLPINRIMVAMRKIKGGYLESRIDNVPTSLEFQLMNETFNSMVSEIQQLKIDIYEEQINSQKAELKHLQLQINPHFYLNSLNIVYYLAEDKNYSLIKELSLSLIHYFRFMFRSHSDFVTLEDEIKHTQNYLRIQAFRFPGSLTYSISVSDSLMNRYVPPLIVQTFVENAIKHAVTLDEPIHIDIAIGHVQSEAKEWMSIRIKDTGKGFSDEVLQRLHDDINLINDEGEHIGIWNILRRLWLLYEGQADIRFDNEQGAVIDIRLPFQQN